MEDQEFLKVVSDSFKAFLEVGTSRSNAKLKPLHGAIASDIAMRLGASYRVVSQGYGLDKEAKIQGRYIDKMVDITIQNNRGKALAGIAVKFVMQNYSQNSNNYFENMLGETANIRSNKVPYFQIFIILDKLPYYNRDKKITKWETFTEHNVSKYVTLSNDNIDVFFHTPNKTLIYVIHILDNERLTTSDEYRAYYKSLNPDITVSAQCNEQFGDSVILNDYEKFIAKVYYTVLAL